MPKPKAPAMTKTCTKCGQTKDLAEFNKVGPCKACKTEQNRAYAARCRGQAAPPSQEKKPQITPMNPGEIPLRKSAPSAALLSPNSDSIAVALRRLVREECARVIPQIVQEELKTALAL